MTACCVCPQLRITSISDVHYLLALIGDSTAVVIGIRLNTHFVTEIGGGEIIS